MCFAKGLHLPTYLQWNLPSAITKIFLMKISSLLKDLRVQEINWKDDIFSQHLYIILYEIFAQLCFNFRLIKYFLGMCFYDQHSIYISPLIQYLVAFVRKKWFLSRCF